MAGDESVDTDFVFDDDTQEWVEPQRRSHKQEWAVEDLKDKLKASGPHWEKDPDTGWLREIGVADTHEGYEFDPKEKVWHANESPSKPVFIFAVVLWLLG